MSQQWTSGKRQHLPKCCFEIKLYKELSQEGQLYMILQAVFSTLSLY